MDIIFFFFVRIIPSYYFMMAAVSSGFSTLSAFLFNSSVSIIPLLIMESINCFLISSLVSLLVFLVFSEPFCGCKQKMTTIPQRKNVMCNLILRRVLLYMIKGCKSTPSPPFYKTIFQINLISKKILKALVKLNPNNSQVNIIT